MEERVNVHFKVNKILLSQIDSAAHKKKMNRTDYIVSLCETANKDQDIESSIDRVTRETRKTYADLMTEVYQLKKTLTAQHEIADSVSKMLVDSNQVKEVLVSLLEEIQSIKDVNTELKNFIEEAAAAGGEDGN